MTTTSILHWVLCCLGEHSLHLQSALLCVDVHLSTQLGLQLEKLSGF
jgi:hypothetical protein